MDMRFDSIEIKHTNLDVVHEIQLQWKQTSEPVDEEFWSYCTIKEN